MNPKTFQFGRRWIQVENMAILFASIVFAAAGFAVAWLVAGKRLKRVESELGIAQKESAAANSEIRNLLQQIVDVTTRMDGDVGRHSRQLTQISSNIEQVKDQQPEMVASLAEQLIVANAHLRDELSIARKEISETQRNLETYVSEARTDMLTGLRNRRSFNEELARAIAQWQRQQTVFGVVMIDVDHFKKFNDTHGHLAGDLVLRSVAQVLSTTLRDMDLVFRYGGEEFVVILPGAKLPDAARAAERIRTAIEAKSVSLKEGTVQVTASLGAASIIDSDNSDVLLQRADDALYAAKKSGRNRVFTHDGTSCVPPTSESIESAALATV